MLRDRVIELEALLAEASHQIEVLQARKNIGAGEGKEQKGGRRCRSA